MFLLTYDDRKKRREEKEREAEKVTHKMDS